jgi:hypothetical protein
VGGVENALEQNKRKPKETKKREKRKEKREKERHGPSRSEPLITT